MKLIDSPQAGQPNLIATNSQLNLPDTPNMSTDEGAKSYPQNKWVATRHKQR